MGYGRTVRGIGQTDNGFIYGVYSYVSEQKRYYNVTYAYSEYL